MKKNIYIIAVALAATTFTGCSHDYNYDGEYDIPGYFHGSDPRNNLVYFPTNVQEYTNDSLVTSLWVRIVTYSTSQQTLAVILLTQLRFRWH